MATGTEYIMDVARIISKSQRLSINSNSQQQHEILIACINADVLRCNTVTMANATITAAELQAEAIRVGCRMIAKYK